MKSVSWRSLVAVLVMVSVIIASAWVVPGDTPGVYTDISGLTITPIVPTVKTQTNSTVLYYSNNPEWLNNSGALVSIDSVNGRPACLAYSNLNVGQTYRIFVAHANGTSAPAQNVGVALMIRTTGTGTFRLNKKNVGIGSDFPGVGVNVGKAFLDDQRTESHSIPTSWTTFDGPYTVGVQQCIVMMYDITITSGSGTISLAVSAAPSGINHVTNWQNGTVWDANKQGPLNNEDHFEAGTFYGGKNVTLNVDLDSMTVGSAKEDRIGHKFYTQSPTSDTGTHTNVDDKIKTNDGWVNLYGGALNEYLPGNFGVIYHYTINFTGSSAKQGAVLIGSGETGSRVSALIMKRPGSGAVALGYLDNVYENQAWLVGKVNGGTTLEFDILIPANINLPYSVYLERCQ